MLRIAIVLLVALLGQTVTAEVPPVEPSDVQIAVLEPGLPDFPPLEKRGLEDPYIASIASEASEAGEIIVVVGTERGERSIWLLQRSAGVVNLGSVHEGWNPVEIDRKTEKQRLLHLAVADPRRELRYAWGAVVYPSGFIEGEMAPELEASRLGGALFELSGLRGRTVVLNWWAIWCLPCVEEIPELNELAVEYAQRPVDFIAIADNQKADVLQFLESREFLYQQAVSLAGTAEVMGRRFPRHIVVAPDGRVVFNISGYGAGSVESLREALALVVE